MAAVALSCVERRGDRGTKQVRIRMKSLHAPGCRRAFMDVGTQAPIRHGANAPSSGARGRARRRQVSGRDRSNRVPMPYVEIVTPTSGAIFASTRSFVP